MNTKQELICIRCPMGCHLEVTEKNNGGYIITGNQCKRGVDYGEKELTNPTRVLTSTVKIKHGFLNRLPVRTSDEISKGLLFETMKVINEVEIEAPVKVGEVVIPNILNTGVDIISSRNMSRR